jgi:hypothetical protein
METLLPFRRARTVAGTPNSRTLVALTPGQAGDLLRDPVAQVVVQEGGAGLPRGRHAECVPGLFHRPPHDRSGLHLPGQLGI